MNKVFITFLLLLLNKISFAQSVYPEVDTLSKYAYFITALYEKDSTINPAAGSCCFLRKNGRLFLITAIHVINGCNRNGKKDSLAPSLMYCIVNKSDTTKQMKIGINRSGIIKGFPCNERNMPDIIALELKIDSINARSINSVEKFIKPKFKKMDLYQLSGFPEYSLKTTVGNLFFPNPSSFKITTGLLFKAYQYGITKEKATNLLWTNEINGKSLRGFSGGPIFGKQENSENIRLLGISSAQSATPFKGGFKYILFVDIEEAIKKYIDPILSGRRGIITSN